MFRLVRGQQLKLDKGDREKSNEMCRWLKGRSDLDLINTAFTDEASFCLGKTYEGIKFFILRNLLVLG